MEWKRLAIDGDVSHYLNLSDGHARFVVRIRPIVDSLNPTEADYDSATQFMISVNGMHGRHSREVGTLEDAKKFAINHTIPEFAESAHKVSENIKSCLEAHGVVRGSPCEPPGDTIVTIKRTRTIEDRIDLEVEIGSDGLPDRHAILDWIKEHQSPEHWDQGEESHHIEVFEDDKDITGHVQP